MKRRVLMLTTGTVEGYEVKAYLGPVAAQFVIGTGVFADLFSAFTDFFGTRSRSYQGKLDAIQENALALLEDRALRLGANAVLGLRVDHDEISGAGKSMLMVTAMGTAVLLDRPRGAEAAARNPEVITSDQMTTATRRAVIVERAENGEAIKISGDEWEFILRTGIPELGPHLIARMEKTLKDGAYGEEVSRVLLPYLGSIDAPSAAALFHSSAASCSPQLFHALCAVAKEYAIIDYSRVAALLEGDDTQARRGLALLEYHALNYTSESSASMGRCLKAVEERFAPAPTTTRTAGLIAKKTEEVWFCSDGHPISPKRERCGQCHRDRFGYAPAEFGPTQAREMLSRKIAVLESAFSAPSA